MASIHQDNIFPVYYDYIFDKQFLYICSLKS
ncbi:hypothetical protein B23_2902 [Geobacillus thermoleovorans B23]|nr:hypothetical protein B23_2902 [Geobacillus thermoleovorans B23]